MSVNKSQVLLGLLSVLALGALSRTGLVGGAFASPGTHDSATHAAGAESAEAASGEHEPEHEHKIVVTRPLRQNVVSTQPYVCQIHSCKHIEIRALEGGYLQEIGVREGQTVSQGDLMFQITPTLYQAKLDTEVAEARRLQIELDNAQTLFDKGIVSPQEIALRKAELSKAQAKVALARAELNFASVRAPFDGIVDRQKHQLGSLIAEGDVLTTLSDNSMMWVYFNVPESRYLEYKAALDQDTLTKSPHLKIELKLANGMIFPQTGKINAIEADFNNKTGNIAFRADFANPLGLLRNGQTGTILMHHLLNDVLVIPQRATFEILDKRYVFVVDAEGIVRQRMITVGPVQDDVFVVDSGLNEGDQIIFEGIRQVRDGQQIEYEFREPSEVLANLTFHAE